MATSLALDVPAGNAIKAGRIWLWRPARPAVAHDTGRVSALDGLRGVLALMVVLSHYVGEVEHGVKAALVGWIAVKVFFVLSGFLMARIITDGLGRPGFLTGFYIRRACRTLPLYLLTIGIVFACLALFGDRAWMEADRVIPLWRYLTFTQTFEMIARGDTGSEWLTPTWTLTVEEQFYLVAPVICLLAGRKHLTKVLVGCVIASAAFRLAPYSGGGSTEIASFVLLPSAGHAMLLGMLAALAFNPGQRVTGQTLDALRVTPIVALLLTAVTFGVSGASGLLYQGIGVPMVALAAAAALAALAHGAPEAARLEAPVWRTLGRLSYGVYLLHMPVLGLLHGLLLGAKPDIATPTQIAVTVAAFATTILLAHAANRIIEEPAIAFGRRVSGRLEK